MNTFNDYMLELDRGIFAVDQAAVDKAIDVIIECSMSHRYIYLIGNGGSAAAASHFAQDLGKGARPKPTSPIRIRAISLSDSVPYITAYGNDEKFEDIYRLQLMNLVRDSDLLIAFSGSGNSPDIVNAAHLLYHRSNEVISFTGFDGGQLLEVSTIGIHVPCDNMGMVEAAHSILCHYMVEVIRDKLTKFQKGEKV